MSYLYFSKLHIKKITSIFFLHVIWKKLKVIPCQQSCSLYQTMQTKKQCDIEINVVKIFASKLTMQTWKKKKQSCTKREEFY
jgi:endonuclease I